MAIDPDRPSKTRRLIKDVEHFAPGLFDDPSKIAFEILETQEACGDLGRHLQQLREHLQVPDTPEEHVLDVVRSAMTETQIHLRGHLRELSKCLDRLYDFLVERLVARGWTEDEVHEYLSEQLRKRHPYPRDDDDEGF